MSASMSTPIQNLPTATVNVSKEEDSTLRDVLKEVELEISAPQPPKAPRVPPNVPLQPQANNTPIIYAMPTPVAPPQSDLLKVGPIVLQPILLKYSLIASVLAAIVYAPNTVQKLYQFVPILLKFQTYEWILRLIAMSVITYVIYFYIK